MTDPSLPLRVKQHIMYILSHILDQVNSKLEIE
jgi:hypothetical protein